MKLTKVILVIACLLTSGRSGLADSILVGTTLTNTSGGAVLCPRDSDCLMLAQQFTLLTPVVVHQLKVVIEGPAIPGEGDGEFEVGLANGLGGGTAFPGDGIGGSGELVFDPNGDSVTQVFDFGGFDNPLGPGTYYLEVSGGNVAWGVGQPLLTSFGTVGPEWLCDPTVGNGCLGPMFWQSIDFPRAFQIDGTAITPEPSSWLLFGTGLLAAFSIMSRSRRPEGHGSGTQKVYVVVSGIQ
jgi:hypothetical protein